MNLSELQTDVNYRRRDATENFISDDEITSYLNQALRKIHGENEWEFTRTSATFSYAEGSYVYALSAIGSDIKEPTDIFYTNSYQMERVTPTKFRMLSGGSYNMYATENDKLLVSTTFGSQTLEIHYYSTHTAKTSGGSWIAKLSSSTDEPLLPTRWEDTPVDFAVARSFQKEGMTDDYSIAYNDYIRALEKMKREYPSRKAKALTGFTNINSRIIGTTDRKENPLHQ